jgi:hypothetical protein
VVENTSAEVDAPSSAETISHVNMIKKQRQEGGKDPIGDQTMNKEGHGYGHQSRRTGNKQYSRSAADIAGRIESGYSVLDRYGTPKDERSNPMKEWKYPTSSQAPFDDVKGDPGKGGLDHHSSSCETTNDSPSVCDNQDVRYIDLEAGEKSDDWSLEDSDAEQYIHEEEDMHNS